MSRRCAPVLFCLSWFPVLLISFVLAMAATVHAQSSAGKASVQELYAEAKAAEARGDAAGATAKYESILRISPRLGAAYNNLGALYLRQRKFTQAAEVLKAGLKVDPALTSASALLGVSLYEMGEYAEARPQLERALLAHPQDHDMELYLANDLIRLSDFDAAVVRLRHLQHA